MLFIVIGSVIAGIVVLVALVAVYQVISYKHLYYELGPEEFNLYSGILNKKRVHVPTSASSRSTSAHRCSSACSGVCTVSIDTAGGSNNKAVQVFTRAKLAEAYHAKLYMDAYTTIDTPFDGKYYLCPICGYIHKVENFTACPICLAPKSSFTAY